ncbi:MAG: imidazolonepropionase-like amidohydrolase [Paraglaciecola sp.]
MAAQQTFINAYKAGVKIAFGTDSSVTHHGENANEFFMTVDAAMSPADTIRSATINSAELLGVQDTLGTLEIGKIADIIAISKNPLEGISTLKKVTRSQFSLCNRWLYYLVFSFYQSSQILFN